VCSPTAQVIRGHSTIPGIVQYLDEVPVFLSRG
jgi:hypothetical protein